MWVSSTQPRVFLENGPSITELMPRGYSNTEGSGVPISMATTVHLFELGPRCGSVLS